MDFLQPIAGVFPGRSCVPEKIPFIGQIPAKLRNLLIKYIRKCVHSSSGENFHV